MDIKKVVCDVQGCKDENAISFSLFKERKADGAGGMENWYLVFDLCPKHIITMLKSVLEDYDHAAGLKLLNDHVIQSRTE